MVYVDKVVKYQPQRIEISSKPAPAVKQEDGSDSKKSAAKKADK